MLMKTKATRVLMTFALVGAFCLSMPGLAQTKRSPVAPNREQVQTTVNEAYTDFKNDTSGKNAETGRIVNDT